MRIRFAFAASAALLAAAPAFAQDAGTPTDASAAPSPSTIDPNDLNGNSITIGGAAVNIPDYEGSNDYRWAAAPAAIGSIGGFGFQLAGNRLSVDLIPNRPGPVIDIQAGPIVVLNFNRGNADQIEDRRVRALGEVDTAWEVGGYVGIGKTGVITSPYDKLSVSLSYRHDVSDVHDSAIWQPSVSYLTPVSTKAAVALFASAERAERGYGRAYFSVTPTQSVASGLPVYNAQGGWKNYTLGGVVTYSLTGNLLKGFKVVAGGTYRRMLNDFADSPLVSIAGKKSQWMGAVGLAYTF
ncbi:MipA/OmpV family protein [Sphingomonas aracearum]|uniref:MipA/OmpV family protein n=1 Tax=Sphingomonas aracearum TaxID=2283317 RepID=A0A369W1Q4_9SPHN|nr:MipA/OmpV family protein [Sphingomonas aracearum]RDE05991.1 MipA/OmpV family protein [Sphingomonas aracearum]